MIMGAYCVGKVHNMLPCGIYTSKGALCAQKLGNGIFDQHFFYTR